MVQARVEEPESSASIEQSVFQTVAAALSLPQGWQPVPAELNALRERLLATELNADETLAVSELSPDDDRVTRIVTLRAREALLDATRTVATARGLALPSVMPEALVVRGRNDATSTLESLREQRRTTQTETVTCVPTLLLADEEAHQTLAAAELAAAETLDQRPTVVRATPALRVLEKRVREALVKAEASGRIAPEDPMIARLLDDKYLIKKRIGKGGFGTVYLAEDKGLGALVAVKVLNDRAARSEQALKSFFDEAKLLTTLDHANIVRWITFDQTSDGLHYFVMEYVQGQQLDDVLEAETQLAPKRVAEILLQVVDALRAAHNHRDGALLHLDLKPNNVLVLERAHEKAPERVKVIDFGISQSVGAAAVPAAAAAEPAAVADDRGSGRAGLERSIAGKVTSETLVKDEQKKVKRARGGTPLYASPEQCEHLSGKEDILALDARSDLYSLGVMAFRMLTGRFPFDLIRTREEALGNHISVAPKKTARVGVKVPRRLAAFVDRCLIKNREQRWPSAEAAYRELDEIVHPRAKVLPIAAGLVVVFGGALAWIKMNQPEPGPTVENLTATDVLAGKSPDKFYVNRGSGERRIRLPKWQEKVTLPPESPPARPVLVDLSEQELAGWIPEWTGTDNEEVRIRVAERAEPADETPALLLLKSGDTPLGKTGVFTLLFIEAWTIGQPVVPGLVGGLKLDPVGSKLRVPLKGNAAALRAIDRVRVSLGDLLVHDERQGPSLDGGEAAYEIPLDKLVSADDRPVELLIQVWDQARESEETRHALELCGERIRVVDAGFLLGKEKVPLIGEDYVITPDMRLYARCSRAGRLSIEVRRDRVDAGKGEIRPLAVDLDNDLRAEIEIRQLISDLESFNGRILLKPMDGLYVHPEHPAREETLRTIYEPLKPELTAAVGSGATRLALAAPPAWNHVRMPADGKLSVQVERKETTSMPLQIDALLLAEGVDPAGREPTAAQLEKKNATALVLTVAAPGKHELRVRGHSFYSDTATGVLVESPYQLFFETSPPEVELRLEPPPRVVNGKSLVTSKDTTVRVTINSASPLVKAPTWRLLRPSGDSVSRSIQGAADSLLVTDAPPRTQGIALPPLLNNLFQPDDGASVDGDYELTMEAENGADTGVKKMGWQIAYRPPTEIRLAEPLASSETWHILRDWQVSVSLTDRNEIQSVQVFAERERDGSLFDLGPLARDEGSNTYRVLAPKKIGLDWSQRMVRFHVTAEDVAGNRSEPHITTENKMPKFEEPLAPALVNRTDQDDRMVLIIGNSNFEYRAGGNRANMRPDEDELDLKDIPIPPGELFPYYLDVHEVTEAQFSQFVEKDYLDPEHWNGLVPNEERHNELRMRLTGAEHSRFPITSIDLAEASAFAHSRGKRLPTLLEWEFAVRGGEENRGSPRDDAVRSEINAGPLKEDASGGRRWDASEVGADFCVTRELPGKPTLRLWNLCSNVREWTWTPEGTLSAQALLQIKRPIKGPKGTYYWAVGASYREGAYSYREQTQYPETSRREDLGFRCALSAQEAHPLVQQQRYDEHP